MPFISRMLQHNRAYLRDITRMHDLEHMGRMKAFTMPQPSLCRAGCHGSARQAKSLPPSQYGHRRATDEDQAKRVLTD